MRLLCKLIGHKWERIERVLFDHNGKPWEEVTHTFLPHCRRCGEPRPNHHQPEANAENERPLAVQPDVSVKTVEPDGPKGFAP